MKELVAPKANEIAGDFIRQVGDWMDIFDGWYPTLQALYDALVK